MTEMMSIPTVSEIHAIADRIIAGEDLSAAQARSLLDIPVCSPEQQALHEAATKVRQHFLGNQVHFCSILNTKSGNCSENCSYCAQASDSDNVDYNKHKWLDEDAITTAADSAADNGASALGLVAAWKGVKEGPQLDMVCESVAELTQNGKVRADVNLGILESQHVADRIAEAGAKVYGHNLETARSFFNETCSTHDFEERWNTIQYIKKAGMGLCSGGIIGMGEDKDQRIEFAEQLRFIEPNQVPINFLNPLEGTGFEDREPVPTDEALITLSVLRLFLPDRNIMVAGGKEITFGDRLHEVLGTGINSVMVGNYLTTLGTGPDYWAEMMPKYGMHAASSCGSC